MAIASYSTSNKFAWRLVYLARFPRINRDSNMSYSRAFLRCPHCLSPSIVRTSMVHSKLLKESVLQCRNPICGHTFSAYTEIVRTISPSACPSSDVCLPISGAAERAAYKLQAAANRAASPRPSS